MPFRITKLTAHDFKSIRGMFKIRTKLVFAVCFALLCLDARAEAVVVTNAAGLSVTLDASGNYTVQSFAPTWTFGGEMGCPIKNAAESSGKDSVGRYLRISFEWTEGGSPMSGEIRLYKEKPLVLFLDTRQSAGELPPAPFPSF